MFSLESFQYEYKTDISRLTIKGRDFDFFVPKTLDRFINPDDVFNNFPLWSKIWEGSIILSEHLAEIPVNPKKRFLEIGSGMGIAGIVASSFGHHVTLTEYNTDATNFARANAEKNLPSTNTNLEILKLDWNQPQLEGSFDFIFGSEIIYSKKNYQPILKLFKKFLKPEGEIILAERVHKTSMEFLGQINHMFDIKAQKKILRSEEGELVVMLCRMKYS